MVVLKTISTNGGTTRSTTNLGSYKNIFKHVKYEHMVAGITGGITSTLILHPLDLIKIRFAGEYLYNILIS